MKKGDDRIVYIPRTLKTICDVAHPLAVQTSKRAVYDTLSSVMAFFQSFSGDTTLLRFAFITEWGQLAPKVQRDMYSKYMCHELNVFLYFKGQAVLQHPDCALPPQQVAQVCPRLCPPWRLGPTGPDPRLARPLW
jgi:hypothetical protein